jgi:hypothetical protein
MRNKIAQLRYQMHIELIASESSALLVLLIAQSINPQLFPVIQFANVGVIHNFLITKCNLHFLTRLSISWYGNLSIIPSMR